MSIESVAELKALYHPHSVIRIADQQEVPLTERVRRLIDTEPFRRLSEVSQLGLVSTVYPGAVHTRFEHSLGVYRMMLLYLQHLAHDGRFQDIVDPRQAELALVAALLHDVGHWPFCHPLEDMRIEQVAEHEHLAPAHLNNKHLRQLLRDDWSLSPDDVSGLLLKRGDSDSLRLLASLLSGPIDVDKMDYLYRDSLHCGVPYGRNFDQLRLISSLCVNERGDALAITEKGRTAAELMVFARYIMFSEVYWHHAVRSATAMLQRAVWMLRSELDWPWIFAATDHAMRQYLLRLSAGNPAEDLCQGLFGSRRSLYKRLRQYNAFDAASLYPEVARQPYAWQVELAERFAVQLGQHTGQRILPYEILIDAPPIGLEVEFRIEIFFPRDKVFRTLSDVSPVVETLATSQFDDYVKRVRVFIHPRLDRDIPAEVVDELLQTSIAHVGSA